MTTEQEAHLHGLKEQFNRQVDKKYRAGALEHTGDIRDLTPLQLIDEALGETVDQYTYLMTLRAKILDSMNGDAKPE